MGIDKIILRENIGREEKGEGSSQSPTFRDQAEKEELLAKRTKMEWPEYESQEKKNISRRRKCLSVSNTAKRSSKMNIKR